MANRHFGKFGDVWKHLPLGEVLQLEQPEHYVESNAGDPDYLLPRDAWREFGVWRYLAVAGDTPVLEKAAYTGIIRKLASQVPPRCPGSPFVARALLGPGATFDLCDLDEESLHALRHAFDGGARVHRTDGASMAMSLLPQCDPRSALVFLDPYRPLERLGEGPSAAEVLAEAGRRGVPAILWYGYPSRDRDGVREGEISRSALWQAFREAGVTNAWWGEIEMDQPEASQFALHSGFGGCGIAAVNLSERSITRCGELGRAVAHAWQGTPLPEGGVARLRFLEGVD